MQKRVLILGLISALYLSACGSASSVSSSSDEGAVITQSKAVIEQSKAVIEESKAIESIAKDNGNLNDSLDMENTEDASDSLPISIHF